MIDRGAVALGVLAVVSVAGSAVAAEKLVATVGVGTIDNISQATPVELTVPFSAEGPITGIGLTGLFEGIVVDSEDGLYPWSLDLRVAVTAPGGPTLAGEQLLWSDPGGDVSFADFPFQDYTAGFSGVPGTGEYTWRFTSAVELGSFRLSDAELHLTTAVPTLIQEFSGTTVQGRSWNRPFFIAGVSGLGPVDYDVLEFEVSESGGYDITSVTVAGTNNFTFLYKGSFDPAQPLENLLDYGLGNGNAPNGTPKGTSLISAMLFEGERYFYVTSQWDRFTPAGPFDTTIEGPGRFVSTSPVLCLGDVNGDGVTDLTDFNLFSASFGGPAPTPGLAPDFDGDGEVTLTDFSIFASDFGCGS